MTYDRGKENSEQILISKCKILRHLTIRTKMIGNVKQTY